MKSNINIINAHTKKIKKIKNVKEHCVFMFVKLSKV